MEPIKQPDDVEGCTCLRCRSTDLQVFRRSIAGDILWAISLPWRHPSVLVLVFAVTVLSWLLWPALETMPQTWPVGTAVAFYVALSTTVLRVYVVGVTTAALQGSVRSARELFVTSQRRLPAVVVTLIAVLIVGAVAIGLASILSWGLLSTLTWVDELAGTSLSSESIYDGASATLIFGSASALAIFKFWLAPEICVVGGYNPLTALRLSWSVTSLHWFRVLIVIVGFSLTVFLPQIGKQTLSALGGSWLLWDPLTGFIQMLFYGVGYAIWFAVGTQIYVRSTLP